MLIPLIKILYNPDLSLPSDIDFYESSIEDIEYFSISPQIYHLLKQRNLLNKTPDFFQQRLQLEANKALRQNLLIRHQTMQIMKTFEDVGVDVIPLKGVRFAEKYFGHIGARWTSDIDLLVKKPALGKALECVKCLGFTIEEETIPSHFHTSFSKRLPNSPIPLTVEIHWDLLKENTSSFNIEAFWNQATPYKDYQHIKELSDYHTFYMICLHGWKHNLNSIKYFLDIIQMVYSLNNQLDYFMLWKDAYSDMTLKRIKRTLMIVYEQFPQLNMVNVLPIEREKDLWWEYLSIRDVNRRSYKQYLNIAQFELGDFDSYKHVLWALRHWIIFFLNRKRQLNQLH